MNTTLIDKLSVSHALAYEEWVTLISSYDENDRVYAAEKARSAATDIFGDLVYLRGIVEFSNICRNDCYYCGIRRSNQSVTRYTLSDEEILSCCDAAYSAGIATFVLQSGEGAVSAPHLSQLIRRIKGKYPDAAVTVSVGELTFDGYRMLRDAGADRYLLRHETADAAHYGRLHPDEMSLSHRMECLYQLRTLGYQTGAGMMVGSPYQTAEHLARDMMFLCEFAPDMIGIGPFIPHKDTPFKDEKQGSAKLTLFLISLIRLMLPRVLLPATTALGTVLPDGREQGILSGANVIMPNISPVRVRDKYTLYNNKICINEETAICVKCLERRLNKIGYNIAYFTR